MNEDCSSVQHCAPEAELPDRQPKIAKLGRAMVEKWNLVRHIQLFFSACEQLYEWLVNVKRMRMQFVFLLICIECGCNGCRLSTQY